MKKIAIFAAMLLTAVSMNSKNVIAFAGDTIRINPRYLGGYWHVQVCMEIDGRCDSWSMDVTYPSHLKPKLAQGVIGGGNLGVWYLDNTGEEVYYYPSLDFSYGYGNISATIPVLGFWDYNEDGIYESYGTAKWEPGRHELFMFNLAVDVCFERGNIVFDGVFNSGSDQRGAVLQGVRFYKKTNFWVGYMRGDVTGNERITVDDVTDLIDLLLGAEYFDEYQIAAADVDRDGEITINDVTRLFDWLMK